MAQVYKDLTLQEAARVVTDPAVKDLMTDLGRRVQSIRGEQELFKTWCDRADNLYYTTDFTDGGADLWSTDKSVTTAGRAHVSVNTPPPYVDIPASLQAVEPIENMLATDTTPEARDAAANLERVYTAWKATEDYELKFHKASTVKGLYGRTAGRVYLEKQPDGKWKPCTEIVEQPRNLYLGYKSDSYNQLEWAAYVIRYEPNALIEQYGVDVIERQSEDGTIMPQVQVQTADSRPRRDVLTFGDARIEVWDYWYRKPVWVNGKFSRMDTYNVVIAGNIVLQGPTKYPEYKGKLPYVPLFNTFIPGYPGGRSELHDVEHLIREKYEKITAGSQMIHNGTSGDAWQLVGPDAPTRVPAGLKPKKGELIGPGPGNRIEAITPFIAQFQLEQYLGRLDRELAVISGLNDLLLGLAPAQVLSSSKAINALIANYESRLSMRRKLLYAWRKQMWELALAIWATKDSNIRDIIAAGGGTLDITDPSLSPRDDMETATRVANLVGAKLMSQRTGMDIIGIDDPETELDLIREESTDATLWPDRVQVMAQLLGVLQSLGLQPNAGAAGQAQGQVNSGTEALRQAVGAATPANAASSQLPGDQGIAPPIAGAGPNEGGAPAPFAAAQEPALMQGMLQGGEAKGRIMTQKKLPPANLGRR